MSLRIKHKDKEFGIGDTVKVNQIIEESGKKRSRAFEGVVIAIKGREENKSFTVRRIGVGQVGIERIFPIFSPSIDKIEVMREGTRGSRHSKLYYIREKPKKEIEKIYSRAKKKASSKKKTSKKKTSKKKK